MEDLPNKAPATARPRSPVIDYRGPAATRFEWAALLEGVPRSGIVSLCLLLAQLPCAACVAIVGMLFLDASPTVIAHAMLTIGGSLLLAGLAFGIQSMRTAGIALLNICGVIGVVVPLLWIGLPTIDYLLHR